MIIGAFLMGVGVGWFCGAMLSDLRWWQRIENKEGFTMTHDPDRRFRLAAWVLALAFCAACWATGFAGALWWVRR